MQDFKITVGNVCMQFNIQQNNYKKMPFRSRKSVKEKIFNSKTICLSPRNNSVNI